MTRIFRFGLATEVVLNVLGAFTFVARPGWCLSFVSPPAQITPLAALLWQLYGALVLALTVPLVLCIPDSRAVYEKRRIVFTTLSAGEIAMITLFLRHAVDPVDAGMEPHALLAMVGFLLPALAWHTFALFVRPLLMQPVAVTPRVQAKKNE